jgi:regulator of cell morphogenesis and NO signaling
MLIQLNSKPLADFDDPIGVLEDCHRRIEGFLEQLITVTDMTDETGTLTEPAALTMIGALRYFKNAAPKHVLDEEETLFPRLRASGDPRVKETFTQIERLEAEHARTDELHASVDATMRSWMDTGVLAAADLAELRRQLEELREIYTAHIKVEEQHVFTLARDVIGADEQLEMGREMQARRRIGIDTTRPLSALVTEVPARARVFDELGLGYCCSGTTSLEDACTEKGLELADVVRKLTAAGAGSAATRDWSDSSVPEIVDYIVTTHHAKLREVLPHAMFLASTVARVHGARKEGVVEAHLSFAKTATVLEQRTDTLEQDVFPKLVELPSDEAARAELLESLDRMVQAQDSVNAGFVQLHEILDDFIVPEGACTKHRTMLATYERMEADLQACAQIENDVLFPRVREQLTSS